jgi:hypothetical protein
MEEKLAEYGLHAEWSEAKDREPIDFEIRDDQDELWATVWGNWPVQDIQIDCDHPVVEFEDDEQVGVCPVCGATCTWHWDVSADDGYEVKEKIPDQWTRTEHIGGIVGESLDRLAKIW